MIKLKKQILKKNQLKNLNEIEEILQIKGLN
jgi:hypothetical protein